MIDYTSIHRDLCRYLARRWHDVPLCVREEIVQEALLRVFVHQPTGKAVAWATVAARWLASRWFRRERRRYGGVVEDDVEALDPFRNLDAWHLGLLIARAPRKTREVLEHVYLRDGDILDLVQAEGGDDRARGAVAARHAWALTWLRQAAGAPAKVSRRTRAQVLQEAKTRQAQIVARLRGLGWLAAGDIVRWAAALECSPHQVKVALATLLVQGALERRGGRWQAEYRVARATREAA